MFRVTSRFAAIAFIAAASLAARSEAFADAPAPAQSQANFEIQFLEGMIDHHAMAVEMASLCPGRVVHVELGDLCENIRTTQEQEIARMQSWLADWYGIQYEPRMKPRDARMLEEMASLSGADFEIEFMEMMIRHHLRAIHEASHCVDRAYHEELETLCENIVTAQAAEIEQMREWLCAWYDICR